MVPDLLGKSCCGKRRLYQAKFWGVSRKSRLAAHQAVGTNSHLGVWVQGCAMLQGNTLPNETRSQFSYFQNKDWTSLRIHAFLSDHNSLVYAAKRTLQCRLKKGLSLVYKFRPVRSSSMKVFAKGAWPELYEVRQRMEPLKTRRKTNASQNMRVAPKIVVEVELL